MSFNIIAPLILPTIVSAFVAFALGALWYGPLFGKAWMQLVFKKVVTPQMPSAWLFLGAYVRQLVTAVILVIIFAGQPVIGGLLTVLLLWLAFIAMPALSAVLWEKKPVALYVINISYELVSLVLQVIIITAWLS